MRWTAGPDPTVAGRVMSPVRQAWTRRFPEPVAAKVPQITALFWVVKVLTTGMGEAVSDYLASVSLVLAGAVGLLGFGLALGLQLRVRRYVPQVYWFTVAMVAVFGTMAADGAHKALGVPYLATTTFYVLAVAAIFTVWFAVEGTLSIHSIVTRRREAFYWLTVLATFALGTAAGDLSALTLHLGFFPSAVLFGAAILVPAATWRAGALGSVAAFWAAYVLTRPLGASLADWLGKPRSLTGLGYGDGGVGLASAVVIAGLVAYLAAGRRPEPAALPTPTLPAPGNAPALPD